MDGQDELVAQDNRSSVHDDLACKTLPQMTNVFYVMTALGLQDGWLQCSMHLSVFVFISLLTNNFLSSK